MGPVPRRESALAHPGQHLAARCWGWPCGGRGGGSWSGRGRSLSWSCRSAACCRRWPTGVRTRAAGSRSARSGCRRRGGVDCPRARWRWAWRCCAVAARARDGGVCSLAGIPPRRGRPPGRPPGRGAAIPVQPAGPLRFGRLPRADDPPAGLVERARAGESVAMGPRVHPAGRHGAAPYHPEDAAARIGVGGPGARAAQRGRAGVASGPLRHVARTITRTSRPCSTRSRRRA